MEMFFMARVTGQAIFSSKVCSKLMHENSLYLENENFHKFSISILQVTDNWWCYFRPKRSKFKVTRPYKALQEWPVVYE